METDIQKFYHNKNIFLTGGTGFLGKVFIEKILRATQVNRIYLLIRPKIEKNVHERIQDIFKDPLYDKLKTQMQNPWKHIVPILGDCSLPQLGISDEDRNELIENVHIVVHSAATTRFNEPLKNALKINTRATLDMLELGQSLKQLQAFVHVSTTFANCFKKTIEERFYCDEIEMNAENACKLIDILNDDMFESLSLKICQKFPNTYCFTKALGEEAVLSHSKQLPICIFRPCIVTPTYKEPEIGWTDNFNGPLSVMYAARRGIMRTVYVKKDLNADFLPVDYCVNMMITCGWAIADSKAENRMVSPPPIYNLVPHGENRVKWRVLYDVASEYMTERPSTEMIWFPFVISTENMLFFNILWLIYHTIPGYLFDFIAMLRGKKRRMVKAYRKLYSLTLVLHYFLTREWNWTCDNTERLWKSLSTEDQKLFTFDMLTINWHQYFYGTSLGMHRFLSNEENYSVSKGLMIYKRFLMLHRATQCLFYASCAFIWWLLFS